MLGRLPHETVSPYTTLFRSPEHVVDELRQARALAPDDREQLLAVIRRERARLRSEEHTYVLQSRGHPVWRLLLEKKKTAETWEIAGIIVVCPRSSATA